MKNEKTHEELHKLAVEVIIEIFNNSPLDSLCSLKVLMDAGAIVLDKVRTENPEAFEELQKQRPENYMTKGQTIH